MAISTSTSFAFLAEGSLKAGTPLDTASTPVRAVQPEAKARRNRNRLMSPMVCSCTSGVGGS